MITDSYFFWEFILFALVTSITPGPNNMMLTASGATFGFLRSIPHMLGIMIGFPFMLLATGVGVTWIFSQHPWVHQVLQIIGAIYLLWLAYRIAISGHSERQSGHNKPLGIWQAAGFQWVNGKAWIMAIGAITTYTVEGNNHFLDILLMAILFAVIGFASNAIWAYFGVLIGRRLSSTKSLRIFNLCMAGLLVISILPILNDFVLGHLK